jgi:hypothetical protein
LSILQLVDSAKVAAEDTFRNASSENSANLEKFLFMLGLTIAHELVHFFTGRIAGDPATDTPSKVNYPPQLNVQRGEAGRYWEKAFLGYEIESYWDPKDVLKEKQAGALYAFGANNTVTRVAQTWVRQTVLFSKSLSPPGWYFGSSGVQPNTEKKVYPDQSPGALGEYSGQKLTQPASQILTRRSS